MPWRRRSVPRSRPSPTPPGRWRCATSSAGCWRRRTRPWWRMPEAPRRGLHHIAYWTDDLAAAMADAESLLGVGPFRVIEHVPLGDFRFQGEPAVLDHSAAFGAWG